MSGSSQDSVINRMQLSFMMLFVTTGNLSSSILFARDLALVRKTLGSGGLYGCLRSLANAPALLPRFCFLSLRHHRLLPVGMVIHWEPGLLAMSIGMPYDYHHWYDCGVNE